MTSLPLIELEDRLSQAFQWQVNFLNECISDGLEIADALRQVDRSYDDLIYAINNPLPRNSKRYIELDSLQENRHEVPFVSFFAGAGGADLGFEAAGFSHVLSIEINRTFCETIRLNRPSWNVIGPPDFLGDVSNRDDLISILDDEIGTASPFEGVFIGGPPCQPFSIAANQRFSKSGENFKRTGFAHEINGNLLFEYIFYILKYRPSVFLLENVPGLIDVDGGRQLQLALSSLAEAGYEMSEPTISNSCFYQVPQKRQRLIIVGSRNGNSFEFPKMKYNLIPCSAALTKPIDPLVKNQETRKHKAGSIKRYMWIDYGKREKLGRVDRLDPMQPSKTVIAGGGRGGGRSHLHPEIPRTLSVRECARLQTFPDSYEFYGSSARQFTQVGNAVPPVLAAQFAKSIKLNIFD